MIKKLLLTSIWIVVLAGIIVVLGFVDNKQKEQQIENINIHIAQSQKACFITENDIYNILNNLYDSVSDNYTSSINIELIENSIYENPYVLKADVYLSINGNLHLDIIQRTPLVRIYNKTNNSFYLDTEGFYMPIHPENAARVIIANGFIDEELTHEDLNQKQEEQPSKIMTIRNISTMITDNSLLKSMIDQIYFTKSGEIELVSKIGGQIICLGDEEDLEWKLQKLETFYKKGLAYTNWSDYSKINLKYSSQVICTKK